MQACLAEGEELLWCGKPVVSMLHPKVVVCSLVGIMSMGFALYGMSMVFESGEVPSSLVGFCVAFVLVWACMAVSFPLYAYRSMKNWLYGLTNRRAILIQRKKFYEYPLKPYMVLRSRTPEGKNGSIVFEVRVGGGRSRYDVEYGFLNTPEAPAVMRMLGELLDGKVSEVDMPMELREQEKRKKYMTHARYFPFVLVLEIGLVGFAAAVAAKLLGWIHGGWIQGSLYELAEFLFFLLLLCVGVAMELRISWLGRRYKKEQQGAAE